MGQGHGNATSLPGQRREAKGAGVETEATAGAPGLRLHLWVCATSHFCSKGSGERGLQAPFQRWGLAKSTH